MNGGRGRLMGKESITRSKANETDKVSGTERVDKHLPMRILW